MAKKHQIFSSNSKTKRRAKRSWRRKAKQIMHRRTDAVCFRCKKYSRRKIVAAAKDNSERNTLFAPVLDKDLAEKIIKNLE